MTLGLLEQLDDLSTPDIAEVGSSYNEEDLVQEIGRITTRLIDVVAEFGKPQGLPGSRWADEIKITAGDVVIRAVEAREPYTSSITVSKVTSQGEEVMHQSEVRSKVVGSGEEMVEIFDRVKTTTESRAKNGRIVKKSAEVVPSFEADGPIKVTASTYTEVAPSDPQNRFDILGRGWDHKPHPEVLQAARLNSLEALERIEAALAQIVVKPADQHAAAA